jgi:hypothetical protein
VEGVGSVEGGEAPKGERGAGAGRRFGVVKEERGEEREGLIRWVTKTTTAIEHRASADIATSGLRRVLEGAALVARMLTGDEGEVMGGISSARPAIAEAASRFSRGNPRGLPARSPLDRRCRRQLSTAGGGVQGSHSCRKRRSLVR